MDMMRSLCLRLPFTQPPPMATPPPPELIEDAIAEILLRLPPDDPACLVRASLVCKLWRRILSDSTFPHRYREFHRTPPLLALVSGMCMYTDGDDDDDSGSILIRRFVPTTTTRIPFLQPAFGCQALDCRHGRVLLDTDEATPGTFTKSLVVWDPITGDHNVLSHPDHDPLFGDSGAVHCAVAGCDHRGCHGGPFLVVFVSTSYNDGGGGDKAASAWVYSSEAAAWSAPASLQIQHDGYALVERKRAAVVGDQLYFLLKPGPGILKYDLAKHCLTLIATPYTDTQPAGNGILMTMEDGSLGFVCAKDDSSLHLWAAKVDPANGSMGWVQDRVIALNNLVPNIGTVDTYNGEIYVVGFAEGMDILLLGVGKNGTGFMFELKSGSFRKLSKPEYYYYGVFFPYLSFYIPDFASHKSPPPAEKI